jgi:hypothetical protein
MPFKLNYKVASYVFQVSANLYSKLEQFTCHLYGSNATECVNQVRYELFFSKKGKVDSSQLPPCQHCLYKHIDRANYQSFIWKRCFDQWPLVPEAANNGWKLDGDTWLLTG